MSTYQPETNSFQWTTRREHVEEVNLFQMSLQELREKSNEWEVNALQMAIITHLIGERTLQQREIRLSPYLDNVNLANENDENRRNPFV